VTSQTVLIAYIAVFIFTFFAASFLIARCTYESPTEPTNFFLLVGASLVWPLTLPLAGVTLLLFGMAMLANKLAGG
jgi:hypothetical protein